MLKLLAVFLKLRSHVNQHIPSQTLTYIVSSGALNSTHSLTFPNLISCCASVVGESYHCAYRIKKHSDWQNRQWVIILNCCHVIFATGLNVSRASSRFRAWSKFVVEIYCSIWRLPVWCIIPLFLVSWWLFIVLVNGFSEIGVWPVMLKMSNKMYLWQTFLRK